MKNTLFKGRVVFNLVLIISAITAGCASESYRKKEIHQTESAATASSYRGPKVAIMIGKFDNKSSYMKGLFNDSTDQLGSQAKTILIGHLQRTRRFSVLERDNMNEIANEAKIKGKNQKIKGADFTITGDVTEFGRKDVGDKQLFGILGSGKKQIAYSKVTLNIVNVLTSEVVYSVSGAGEYELSDREVLGFGGSSGYDSTLNGKVLDLSIREATDRLTEGMEQNQWNISAQ
jgi:curli biogenesis system outer membrane secretion channel CsgG